MATAKNEEMKPSPEICEAHCRGVCPKDDCSDVHHSFPYLWQVHIDPQGWLKVEDSETVEKAFCELQDNIELQTSVVCPKQTLIKVKCKIHFKALVGEILENGTQNVIHVTVRRLSTRSYISMKTTPQPTQHFYTVWTWYSKDGHTFKQFGDVKGTPHQCILESKYLAKQEIFRFEVLNGTVSEVYLLDYRLESVHDLTRHNQYDVLRRPKFLSSQDIGQSKWLTPHPRQGVPFTSPFPDQWSPVNTQSDYELVPLNPQGMEYHLIYSEFKASITAYRKIEDIYRIQNPFLWHKYYSKKCYMEHKGIPLNERRLFHGTADPRVVPAIFRENFDTRIAGKNATMFGKGAYFAFQADYSDRYTGHPSGTHNRWMFMVRVLVGRPTLGQTHLVRPPPINLADPYGELYNSCVDNMNAPKIYVLFDNDQYYPEYVLCYKMIGNGGV